MTRKRLTERQTITVLLNQKAIIPCGCGCRELITHEDVPKVIKEHYVPIALGGADEIHNMGFLLGPCADLKTNGRKNVTSLGSDKHAIAKDDRINGRTKQGPKKKIPSRPMPEQHDPWGKGKRM